MLLKKKLHTRLFETSLLTVTIALFGQALVSPLADAQAGALQVWPIEVSLEGNNDVVQVNVNNTAGAETFVQAMVVAWPSSDVPGALKPTDDVMVSPPVFDLPANGSQTVRLALRRPLEGDTERTYRLVVTELAKTAGLVPNTLNVAVSMNMPVFATPQGAEAKPAWSFANTDFDGQHLVVTNEGNARPEYQKDCTGPCRRPKAVV